MPAPYYIYGGNLLNRETYTSVVNTTYGTRRYFSSIDTDVYFGDKLIDEMVAFDFMIEEKKMPIFGYNNFVPKRIVTGQKVIQGSFAINFTETFNMKKILEGLADSIYANEYEETMFYCADDNKAIFGKGFDITLSYGDAKGEGSYNACTQTLVGCYITSYRQAFDTSGEPILDMYTFIAKDLLIVDNGSTEIIDPEPVPEYDSLEPPTGTGGKEEAEPYVIANNRITKEADELYAYCKDHPETLGILIDPTYDYVDGKSRISIFIMPYNDIELLIDRITIELTDIGLSGSYSFTLDKRIDKWNFYYELIGTNIQTGKHIKSLFEEGTVTNLECCVSIDCNDRTNTFNIRQYATLLHSGTIDTNYN
jgi:hypothetical protein